ncbi:MAG: chromosomal replication initiator protein DnaA [Phycisphaerales bacterium]|nr:chromosomal replication initiator protein DnaA [Phycisphaerales bacterium]
MQAKANTLKPSVWNEVVEYVRVHHPDLAHDWFSELVPQDLTGGVLVVAAANRPQVRYLDQQCRRAFAEAAQAALGRLISVSFESNGADEEPRALPLSFEHDGAELSLSAECRFDRFITGPCNRLAHAAAVAVADRPGNAYNPLFLHGDVGLGKTHLLQAICHEVRERRGLRPMYISCETFANHFLEAVERGAMQQFRYRYRHVDALIIDDIQFLGDRERSQEEFFHTFNTLYQSQRQIVLSADCSPAEIPALQDRLVSRFNSGVVALMDRPCLETRMAIVGTKAKARGIELPEDVIKLIAMQVDSNVRELEGALAKVDLLSQTRGAAINMSLALEALGQGARGRSVSIPDVLDLVSQRYQVRLSDLQGKRRHKSIVLPRQVCMYLARELTSMSLEEIGGYFGGRDHTTVIHAHRTITKRRSEVPSFDSTVEELTLVLRQGAIREARTSNPRV